MSEGQSRRAKSTLLRKYGFNTPDEHRARRLLEYHQARAASPNKQQEIKRAFGMRVSKPIWNNGSNENNSVKQMMYYFQRRKARNSSPEKQQPGQLPALPHDVIAMIYATAHPATQARMYAAIPAIRRDQTLHKPVRDHLRGTGDMQGWWKDGPKRLVQVMGVAPANQKGQFLFLSAVIQALKKAYADKKNLEGLRKTVRNKDPYGVIAQLSPILGFGKAPLTRAAFVDSVLMTTKFLYMKWKQDIFEKRTITKAKWSQLVKQQRDEEKRRRTEQRAKTVRNKEQRRAAATTIQKAWRGLQARRTATREAEVARARRWRNRPLGFNS